MRKEEEEDHIPGGRKPFIIISKALKQTIDVLDKAEECLFIFAARRGLSPLTVCGDCGTTVTCDLCNTAAVLFKAPEENVFVCRACGRARSAKERCAHCDSWRLETLGIGIQRIEQELKKLFPDTPVFIIDRESAKTPKSAQKTALTFYRTRGSILLGTEMALPYLREQVAHVAVASIDSLLSLPEWKISENVFTLLLALRGKAEDSFIVQTRKGEFPLLSYVMEGSIIDFYHSEIALREQLGYPPFSTLIKLAVSGSLAFAKQESERLETFLSPHKLHVYQELSVGRGKYMRMCLLRLSQSAWPDAELSKRLSALPPHITVVINPESLF